MSSATSFPASGQFLIEDSEIPFEAMPFSEVQNYEGAYQFWPISSPELYGIIRSGRHNIVRVKITSGDIAYAVVQYKHGVDLYRLTEADWFRFLDYYVGFVSEDKPDWKTEGF